MSELPDGLVARIAQLYPGARVVGSQLLTPDRAGDDTTTKAEGYGLPRRIEILDGHGRRHDLVFRTASANDFGHDRRADRASGMLLAFDTFNRLPRHVRAIDVGALMADGQLCSVRGGREFYLITDYAPGHPYADDLRRLAADGQATPLDLARCEALAGYLVGLHATRGGRPAIYTRAIRDLLGHGEGIFGIVDGYPADTPAAPPERLHAIERRCLEWRWRLRGRADRLVPCHGDFHPFNILFGNGAEFTALDASRGGAGDAADDVTAMAVNFVFFALERPKAWQEGLGRLWHTFWDVYLKGSGDHDLLACAAPFLAWRGLVVANPLFYPHLAASARDRLLGFIEGALEAPALDLDAADELFSVTGRVVWITGLPASGKSTLARRVRARLGGRAVLLDGDEIRDCLDPRPGYGEAARDAFYRTLGRLAALLARQGHVVLVPATAPRRAHRDAARALAPAFTEVHVRTGLAACEERDPKGLFARARRGEAPDLPGLGTPYEPPASAEIVADGGEDEAAVSAIVALVPAAT